MSARAIINQLIRLMEIAAAFVSERRIGGTKLLASSAESLPEGAQDRLWQVIVAALTAGESARADGAFAPRARSPVVVRFSTATTPSKTAECAE